MSTTIKLKKSGETGNVPSNSELEFGEIALNYADGILYYKDPSNAIQQISGTSANTFETINANGAIIIADSNTDILTLSPGTAINIAGDGITDTITIGVRTDDTYTSNSVDSVATANIVNAVFAIATAAFAKANNPITVREVYSSNGNVVNTFANISTIQFDTESGMAVVDEGNNTVTIQLNSTFKYWNVDGSPGLEAFGLDTVNFLSGDGVSISANNSNTPKSILFSVPELANAYAAANAAANTVRVSQNSGSTLSAKQLNFVNTANVSIVVTDSGDGNANIEFEVAAGGGGSTSTIESDVFSANGVQNTFTLTKSTSTDKAFVYISGVAQVPQVDYQVSGKNLTFNTAPLNGTTIEVRSIIDVGLVNASSFISDQFVANGVQNVFTLSTTSYSTNGVFVFVDGVTQVPVVDYSVSGNTITFVYPPEANGIVEIRSVEAVQVPLPSLSNNGTTLSLSDSQYSFTSGGFANSADSISRTYILRGTTTSNTESELFLNGTSTRISVPANTTMFYSVDVVARRTDATDESAGYHLKGVVDNFSGTVADVGSLYEVVVAEDDADYVVDARADNTNNTINIFVTGETGKTIRWTALVKTVEVGQ
jgi:hypothetical protein